MKILSKITTMLLLLLLCVSSVSSNKVYASNNISSNDNIVYEEDLSNGDKIIVSINVELHENTLLRASTKVTATKTYTYKNNSNETMWTFAITGTFTYNGSTSTCDNASNTVNIYNVNWKKSTSSSSTNGNKATGSVKMNLYSLGILLQTISETLNLSCDVNGNLS